MTVSTMNSSMEREMRDYEKKLYEKITHEHFSMKKVMHIIQLGHLYECSSIS